MRSAILTDLHANREAFEAVLADLEGRGIDRLVFLGDLVGYGPDPDWVLDKVETLVAKGALAVRGNHDRAVCAPDGAMNPAARRVIDWTVNRLNARQKLLEDNPTMLRDQVGRAFAILRYAFILTSKEALNLLSMLRLGADLDLVPNCDRSLLDMLLLEIQPAHLQLDADRELSPEDRDVRRAEITRLRLQSLDGPTNFSNNKPSGEASPGPDDE